MPQRHPRSRLAGLIRSTLLACLMLLTASSLALARDHRCEARAIRAHRSIQARQMDSWEPVDDRTVLIWNVYSDRAHLVRLRTPIPELQSARILTLIDGDHDGFITACGRDGVLVLDGAVRVARISSIEYLSAKRTAELDRQPQDMPIEADLEKRHRPRGRLLS